MNHFTTQIIPLKDGRILYAFKSPELNIVFISSSQSCSLSFNLEVITKNKSIDVINKLKNYIDFYWEEITGHALDFNVVCRFNGRTNEYILNGLSECFNLGLAYEHH